MSTHLSASQRTILSMQRRITELEQMQKEYNAFLNYMIRYFGYSEDQDEEKINNVLCVHTDQMKKVKLLPVRSEVVNNGARMELRRVDNTKNNDIITLPS
jgi:hypothetical protein